jgi:hypothetical protein
MILIIVSYVEKANLNCALPMCGKFKLARENAAASA